MMLKHLKLPGIILFWLLSLQLASAQGFNPYYVPGGMGCPGRVERHGIAWICRCPDGSLARGTVINGHWVSVCNMPPRHVEPLPAPAPQPAPPGGFGESAPPSYQGQAAKQASKLDMILQGYRGCLNAQDIEGVIYYTEITGFSYAKKKVWKMRFVGWNRVVFLYASGRSEENLWAVQGRRIYLRNPRNGRLIGVRKLCVRDGYMEWVSGSGKRLGRILAIEDMPAE